MGIQTPHLSCHRRTYTESAVETPHLRSVPCCCPWYGPYAARMAITPITPVVVPVHSGTSHGGSDIPTPYVVAYAVVALLVWFVVAAAAARRVARDEHRGDGPVPPPDGEQLGMGLVIGACVAIAWPLSAVAGGMWLGIRRFTQGA